MSKLVELHLSILLDYNSMVLLIEVACIISYMIFFNGIISYMIMNKGIMLLVVQIKLL